MGTVPCCTSIRQKTNNAKGLGKVCGACNWMPANINFVEKVGATAKGEIVVATIACVLGPILVELAPVKEIFIADWSQMTNCVKEETPCSNHAWDEEHSMFVQQQQQCNKKAYEIIIIITALGSAIMAPARRKNEDLFIMTHILRKFLYLFP